MKEQTRSNRDLIFKLVPLIFTLIAAIILIVWFWAGVPADGALLFSAVAFYFVLPVVAFVLSLFIGASKKWGKIKWLMPFYFGVIFLLCEYFTFSLSNMLSFDQFNWPHLWMLLPGIAVSLVGMILGKLLSERGRKEKKGKE